MAVTADVKLALYNEALRIIGSRKLASLTENRKPRHLLDDAWGGDIAVIRCLERADWNFATRSVEMAYDPGIEPSFGFRRAYAKPDDFVRLTTMSANEYMRDPMTHDDYLDEAGYWLCDLDTLYLRFVSSGNDFGLNSGGWPQSFKQLLAAYLAEEIAEPITNSTAHVRKARAIAKDALTLAKSRDAMDEGVKFPPQGSWVRSRGSSARRGHRIFFS